MTPKTKREAEQAILAADAQAESHVTMQSRCRAHISWWWHWHGSQAQIHRDHAKFLRTLLPTLPEEET